MPCMLARLMPAVLALAIGMLTSPALSLDKAQLFVTQEDGFARLILDFSERLDLPAYQVKYDNNVLAIDFDQPIDVVLPDIPAILPDYVSIARTDPDQSGIRLGLRTKLNVNQIVAGEQLFIDLMPATWQGLPPALPPDVVAALAERAKYAAELAAQQRKKEEADLIKPAAELRVGRNPTFLRLLFNWNADTEAEFTFEGTEGNLHFDWPVPVDLYALKSELPAEVISAENVVGPDGTHVVLKMAEGVVPRFYTSNKRHYIIDIDLAKPAPLEEIPVSAEADATAADLAAATTEVKQPEATDPKIAEVPQAEIVPFAQQSGSTVRITFPFDNDTPSAVFRRGDTVWMLFDTTTAIKHPEQSEAMDLVAKDFSVVPAGDSQVVRITLANDRLATLGSEGRAWVLSLGDLLLSPTEPVSLVRRRDGLGQFEITADLARPGRVHQFRDPIVGDLLSVVTAYPPARGVTRNLNFVDFQAIRSINGLVIKPQTDAIKVAVDQSLAVISGQGGLTVSALDQARAVDAHGSQETRASFIDFALLTKPDLSEFASASQEMIDLASRSEGKDREKARLDLARLYVGNQFSFEAIGVLKVLNEDLKSDDLKKAARLTLAIANTLAGRSSEALTILNAGSFPNEADALMWRTIAKTEAGDYNGAHMDAQSAEAVADSYPMWVQTRFLLAATRAAVESDDGTLAGRFLSRIEYASLNPEDASLYQLLSGRISEAQGRKAEALDTYGQVITADIRPTRAEAVFRTLLILNGEGKIDLAKATETLASESLMWRGGPLEAQMQRLLADLYFRHADYRDGFETVRQAVSYYPESAPSNAMAEQAQQMFGELYLNGRADTMSPVDALSLFYDYRNLTPPGSRGDEMIRNLARRLVKVDLLSQAAELLRYQIENRLKGVAQAQIAADLAVIEIADRRPQEALTVLNKTRLADLSPSLERQRRVLEARALIDAGRHELALDFLSNMVGRDVELLRIDAHWAAKRYSKAAELIEVLYNNAGESEPLSQPARMNIIKAAVGFVLSDDRLGLSRLRDKYAPRMSQSAEWPMFDFVTSTVQPDSAEFRKVASAIASIDSINAFLASYKEYYSSLGALTPATATRQENAV